MTDELGVGIIIEKTTRAFVFTSAVGRHVHRGEREAAIMSY